MFHIFPATVTVIPILSRYTGISPSGIPAKGLLHDLLRTDRPHHGHAMQYRKCLENLLYTDRKL